MKNPKIIAAFAIGCAFVLLALVFSDFGTKKTIETSSLLEGARVAKAPERTHIPVTDANNNNIPDWQEQIVPDTGAGIVLANNSEYTPPDTLTGQVSIEFFKQFMDVKSGNSFAVSEEDFIEQFADTVVRSTGDIGITASDVPVNSQNDPATLRAYVNAMAQSFLSTGFVDMAGDELTILNEAIDVDDPAKLDELTPIISALTRSISQAQSLPVPSRLVQEHINIINSATSVRNDIIGMGKIYEDPMYAFVRLRSYEQDTVNITEAFLALEARAVELGAQFVASDPINFQ